MNSPENPTNVTPQPKRDFPAALRAAFPRTLPVLTGFLVLGIAYGILMDAKGYNFLWSGAMSALAFCGSMQYVAVTLLTGAFEPLQAFLLALMVNARHLFYGLSLLGKYRGTGKRKPLLIFWLCDETFSLVSSLPVPEHIESGDFYLAVSLLDYLYWVGGSVLGGILGSFITFDTMGLDFALTALFVVLFLEKMKGKSAICGVLGVLSAVTAIVLFGADNMVIPAMAFLLVFLLGGRKFLCD